MSDRIEFGSGDTTVAGYRAATDEGGPGVLVLHSSWGMTETFSRYSPSHFVDCFVYIHAERVAMATTTVRISDATRNKLRQLAEETGQPMQAVLDQALDVYRRDRFFAAIDRAYTALWSDPEAGSEELAERRLFEGTLADDLNEEE